MEYFGYHEICRDKVGINRERIRIINNRANVPKPFGTHVIVVGSEEKDGTYSIYTAIRCGYMQLADRVYHSRNSDGGIENLLKQFNSWLDRFQRGGYEIELRVLDSRKREHKIKMNVKKKKII